MTGTSAVMMGGQMPLQDYEGGCHCGAVRFRVTGDLARVTECNCSMCSKKGFLHLIVAPDAFELISGKDALTTNRFNTGTAKHTFCTTCGIHPSTFPARPDKIDVNVRCLTASTSRRSPHRLMAGIGSTHAEGCRGDRIAFVDRLLRCAPQARLEGCMPKRCSRRPSSFGASQPSVRRLRLLWRRAPRADGP
jgi:hypothetical protein